MTYTVTQIKSLPAPSVKKLLRERGWNLSTVAARRDISQSLVSRVIRKQVTSAPVLEDIAWCLNHPRVEQVA